MSLHKTGEGKDLKLMLDVLVVEFCMSTGSDEFSEKLEFHMTETFPDKLFVLYFRLHLYSCRISLGINVRKTFLLFLFLLNPLCPVPYSAERMVMVKVQEGIH